MSRPYNKLSSRAVETAVKLGRLGDGGGLYLKIDKNRRRWVFRFVRNGRARELGLGAHPGTSLAEARKKAVKAREALAAGHDPIEAKRAVPDQTKTFGQCAIDYIEAHRSEWRSAVHTTQWRSTINTYCASILDRPVREIDRDAIVRVLEPIWQKIPETASRLRGRIEVILDSAQARGLIDQNIANPARWKGHLKLILSSRGKLDRGHFAAMDYRDLPEFMAQLCGIESIPAYALMFLILTGARLGEVLNATWGELDLAAKVWVIPAWRMKAGVVHRVPLTAPAMGIITACAEVRHSDRIFPVPGKALRKLLPSGATIHGFRASFRMWAAEQTNFPSEVCELALAHAIGDATQRAYNRSDLLERRRALMEKWTQYLDQRAVDYIIPIGLQK